MATLEALMLMELGFKFWHPETVCLLNILSSAILFRCQIQHFTNRVEKLRQATFLSAASAWKRRFFYPFQLREKSTSGSTINSLRTNCLKWNFVNDPMSYSRIACRKNSIVKKQKSGRKCPKMFLLENVNTCGKVSKKDRKHRK